MIKGIIQVKDEKGTRNVFSPDNSEPDNLMRKIFDKLEECKSKWAYNKFKYEIEDGTFTDTENLNVKIDYLWHEYVYVIDFQNQSWDAYETNSVSKKLNPILINIKFKDKVIFVEDEYEEIKVLKVDKEENYKDYEIILSKNMFYLIIDEKIIIKSKNKKYLIAKAVARKL